MSLQLEWQYLQRTVSRFGTLMVPIKDSLRENFFPMLFRWEYIDTDLWKFLGHRIKRDGLDILEPLSSEDSICTSPPSQPEGKC